jgi:hypothetical protein
MDPTMRRAGHEDETRARDIDDCVNLLGLRLAGTGA